MKEFLRYLCWWAFISSPVIAQQIPEKQSGAYLREINAVVKPGRSEILIENVRIIDGNGGIPIEKGYVVVKDGVIAAVETGAATEGLKKRMSVVNAEGKSLLPGLIDAHLHSINDSDFLQLCLSNGITALRDPGHPFTFYQAIHFTDNPLPRIFLTGPHLDYPPAAYGQEATLVRNSDHARQVIRQYAENGASGIKIYYRLPLRFYKDVVETAGAYSLPVVAHLELTSAVDAMLAGIDGIEHVTSFGTSIAGPEARADFEKKVDENNNARREERYRLWASLDMDSPKVGEVIALAVKKDIVFCPTLAAFERQADSTGKEDYRVKGFQNMMKFVKLAHKAGVKIVIGSHSSSLYSKHGWTYQREMELLNMAGLTPLEVIKSGTVLNAAYFGNSPRLGSIAAGKAADLVLVDGNPSENIEAMYNIIAVMINGAWFKK